MCNSMYDHVWMYTEQQTVLKGIIRPCVKCHAVNDSLDTNDRSESHREESTCYRTHTHRP